MCTILVKEHIISRLSITFSAHPITDFNSIFQDNLSTYKYWCLHKENFKLIIEALKKHSYITKECY